MRILIYGNFWEGSMELSYARAFQSLGWDVIRFDPHAGQRTVYASSTLNLGQRIRRKLDQLVLKSFLVEAANRRLLACARKTRPELIFVFKGVDLAPPPLQRLRQIVRAPLFVYHPDHPFIASAASWNRNILASLPLYDCHFCFGRFLLPILRARGAPRAEHLACAYDPELLGPVPENPGEDAKFSCDVAFAGTWDAEREEWLGHLAGDVRLLIYGNEWENCRNPAVRACWKGRPVYGRDFARLCRTAPLRFNFVRTANNHSSHNMRTFEIPGCGGLAFTNRTEEQVEYFREDREMVFFSTPGATREKARALMGQRETVRAMKRAAYAAARPHTYQARAAQIAATWEEMRGTRG